MVDSTLLPPSEGTGEASRREPALVTTLATVAVVVVVVPILVASNYVGTGLEMPGFPGQSVQSMLFMGEADGTVQHSTHRST